MTVEGRTTSVPCKHCGRMCGGPAGLASHIRSMHPDKLTPLPSTSGPAAVKLTCPHCGTHGFDRAALAAHLRDVHASSPETPPRTNGNLPDVDDGIVWEDPPSGRRGSSLIEGFRPLFATLKASPDRWARVRTYESRSAAGSGRNTLSKAFPEIQFRAGMYGTGSALWARYVEPDQ